MSPTSGQGTSTGGNSKSDSNKGSTSEVLGGMNTWEVFRINRLFKHDQKSRIPKDLQEAIKNIVDGRRGSAMKPEEAEEIVEDRPTLQHVNEATFVDMLWKSLIRQIRKVKNEGINLNENIRDEYYDRAWKKSHLSYRIDQPFHKGTLPAFDYNDQAFLKKLYKLVPKIKDPKPDLVYGLTALAFTDLEREINMANRVFTSLDDGLFYVFFLVEFKGSNGSIAVAETQACRAGTSAINSMRNLKLRFNAEAKKLGDDPLDFAFSLCPHPETTSLWVHWSETGENDEVSFHMARWRSYIMSEAEHLVQLRHDIDNVLDWGTTDRLTAIKRLLSGPKE